MKILFICRGNVGRSQMAAALYKKINPDHEVFSAGTKVEGKDGLTRHGVLLKDTKGAERVLDVLKEEGIDIGENPRIQLNQQMLDGMDKIIVMSEPEHIPEWLSNHPNYEYWQVVDPKDTPIEFHRETREKIKTLLEKLADNCK